MESKKSKLITYKHLERLLTCQEYFVWNVNIENLIEENIDEFENNEDENFFWDIVVDSDIDELQDYKFVEIIKNGFNVVNESFVGQIKAEAKNQNKTLGIVNEKSNELACNKTLEYLNNSSIDWILNPIFVYEDVIIKPSLYRKDNHELSSLIYGSKTKLKNYIRPYFEYNVMKKLGIKVDNYCFYTFDSTKDYYEPKTLSFVKSQYCWTQKNKPSKDIKQTIEEYCVNSIIEKLKSGVIKTKTKSVGKGKKIEIPEVVLSLNQFDELLNQIRGAKKINVPSDVSLKDNTMWGVNPNFLELVDFDKLGLKKVSGNLLKKNELLDIALGIKTIDDFKSQKRSLEFVLLNKNVVDREEITKYVDMLANTNVVWYDFEGFSMPYPVVAHTKPYQQVVFQVSIIRTVNMQEVYKENVVIDPLNLNWKDFETIINKIYWKEANYYVVYNKSYEHTRIKEMMEVLQREIKDINLINELEKQKNAIIDNTCDLLDLFNVTSSKENIPPIFLSRLLGFSSIKKIEKLITEDKLQLDVMITPYKELEVQNGLMAMNKAIQRHLKSIGDIEWNKETKNLATYCENDVKAMIMVYYFIKKFIS